MLGMYLGETRASPRRIRFTPPTEMFTLCHYTAQGPRELPIKAVYDMKVYTHCGNTFPSNLCHPFLVVCLIHVKFKTCKPIVVLVILRIYE